MLIRWKFGFLYIVCSVCGIYGRTDSFQTPNPNYIAPSYGRPGTIMPFSLYKQKIEKEKLIKSLIDPYEDGSRPVKVYLPAFKNANQSQISQVDPSEAPSVKKPTNKELDTKIQAEIMMRERMRSRFRGPIRPQLPNTIASHQPPNLLIADRKPRPQPVPHERTDVSIPHMPPKLPVGVRNRFVEQPVESNRHEISGKPFRDGGGNGQTSIGAKTYSTGTSRQQLSATEMHKSVFKHLNQPSSPETRPGSHGYSHKSTLLSLPPDRPHTHQPIDPSSSTEKEGFSFSEYYKFGAMPHLPRLTNGVPLEPQIAPIVPSNYQGIIEQSSIPSAPSLPYSSQYTPIQPLSAGSNNILESLLGTNPLKQLPANLGGLSSYQNQYGPGVAPQSPVSPDMNLSPIQQLLGGGSPLEHMAKLAKNLLTTPEGNQIINRLGNLLDTKGTGNPLTSNAISSIIKPASEVAAPAEKAAETAIGAASNVAKAAGVETAAVEEVVKPAVSIASGAQEAIASASKDEDGIDKKLNKLMEVLPSEQRNLLEAALKSGEITPEQVSPTLSSLVEQNSTSDNITLSNKTSLIHNEGKLMEWIQQNRPRSSAKETMDSKSPLSPEKLPYYGKYCGSFVENRDSNKKFGVNGAVWAVDDKHLMVSKFFFQPGSSMENITFWAGPNKIKGDPTIDIFPSDNGFYLRPEPVNIRAFIPDKIEVIKAKVRGLSEEVQKIVRSVNVKNSSEIAEVEESLDEQTFKIDKNELRRMKRDAFREVYEGETIRFPVKIKASVDEPDLKLHIKGSSKDPAVEKMFEHDKANQTSILHPSSTTSPLSSTSLSTSLATTTLSSSTTTKSTSISMSLDSNTPKAVTKSPYPVPLEWSAGFQPLLLTFPDDRWVKNIHWLSLYDHKRKETIAFVLMPNGAAFQIPSMVQLRPFALNPPYKASSGPIQIADTKTIVIHEFSLQTDGLPVWFLVGKDIIPNSGGHIVPVYDKKTGTFDCDSLRDYKNETVILKLPGTLDIKDVYYFAVYSIPKSVSLTSIHVPYLDLQVPPNLEGISAPKCLFER